MKNIFNNPKKNRKPVLLRSKALALYCVILIITQFAFNFTWAAKKKEVVAATKITAEDLFNLTNKERTDLGLPALKLNSQLASAAYNKGVDMFADQYWAHVAPDGTTPWAFILAAGYDYHYAGENLAKDFTIAASVVQAWMNSPSHRENIVNSNFEDMGIAVVSGTFEGQETAICIQMFGALMPEAEEDETPSEINETPTNDTPNNNPSDNGNYVPPEIIEEIDTTPPQAPIITSPSDNAVLNNDQPEITGLSEEEAMITVYDAQNEIGSVPTDLQNAFSFRPETALKEGEHLLSATATDASSNKSEHSKTVTVLIDTFPPFIDEDSITIEAFYRFSQKALRIEVIVLADPQEVVASMGDYSLILNKEANNRYLGVMAPPEEFLETNKEITIQAHDEAGNIIQVKKEIPVFSEKNSSNSEGKILGFINSSGSGFLNTIVPRNHQETSRMFYSVFGIGLMGLMTINSAVVEKKKIEIEGSSTLTHAFILGISLMGVIFGNLGVIQSGLNAIR